ncbi:MAG TPA: efflux RND transporter periplasmic adaptor subunit [Bellilinea sp.]|nr:efflux RND transporter periplasmic adaptor subunit [Bellilinea sp.]
MNHQKQALRWVLPVLTTALILVGCTGQNATATQTTTGTGTVTQVSLVTTVDTTGSISPRQVASVNWATSGTITTVDIRLGQKVAAGDVLMTLDPNSVPDSLVLAQLNLAEMTSPSAIAAAQKAVIDAQSAVNDAQIARNNLDYKNQGAIDDAYAAYIIAQQKYEKAQETYNSFSHLPETDPNRAMWYQNLYAAKVAMDSARYKYNSYSGTPTAFKVEESDNTLTLAQYALDEAQNYLNALTSKEVAADATGQALLKLKETRMAVDSLNLRAPFAGIVGAIYDQPGIVVANGHTGVVLVDRSKLYVTVSLTETDVVKLSAGNTATIVVDALPDLKLTGHVITIDPMGVANQGVVYYSVIVELDQADDQIPLNSTASVTIQIGEPQLGLAVPVTAIQSDTESEYVSVMNNGAAQRVNVVSGRILADDTVVITGDLKVGAEVLLVQQASTTSSENPMGGGGFMLGGRP